MPPCPVLSCLVLSCLILRGPHHLHPHYYGVHRSALCTSTSNTWHHTCIIIIIVFAPQRIATRCAHRYESEEDAKRALVSMDGMSIDGLTHGNRKLKVKPFVAPAKKHSDWGNVAKRFPVRPGQGSAVCATSSWQQGQQPRMWSLYQL